MKTSFTNQEILDATRISLNRLIYYYNISNIPYSWDYNLSIQEIMNSLVPVGRKTWFLINVGELTNTEQLNLKNGLASIVLPIFQNKYPSTDCNLANAEIAVLEGNEDAYNSCMAQFYSINNNSCMYCAYAAFYYSDTSYITEIVNYLITFTS